jgi:hypothetical protein
MHLSSLSPNGGRCGPYFGGMVSRKQRAAQAGYWLVLKDQQPKVETLSQASYPALFYLHHRWKLVVGMITSRMWGDYKVKPVLLKRRCSLEGNIWWPNNATSQQKNNVEQVFKVGTYCWLNKSSSTGTMIQEEVERKSKGRTQCSTGSKTLQWSSPQA